MLSKKFTSTLIVSIFSRVSISVWIQKTRLTQIKYINMEIKKETMLDDTGAANKRRKPKHWQMPHYPKNTLIGACKEDWQAESPQTKLCFSRYRALPSHCVCGRVSVCYRKGLHGGLRTGALPTIHVARSKSLRPAGVQLYIYIRGFRVCQLGSDGNRSLAQHTFIALLLHAKKCTKIWDCVTQQRKRLISRKPPCLGREIEYQHKVVKSYEGDECHESMEEGF
nr:uncharacterized protein LOC129532528 [Gorilla gorilla gorilla]